MGRALLPMSAADIWGSPDGCTGWVAMNQYFPNTSDDDEEAQKGVAAHWVGSTVLKSYLNDDPIIPASSLVDQTAPNGMVVNDEMIAGANEYVTDVLEVAQKVGGLQSMYVEHPLKAPDIHESNRGDCDCFIFDRETMSLWIWEFKFGYSVVEVYKLLQLVNYAAAIFKFLNINGLDDQAFTVHFRVVQPRAFHREGTIREWTVTGSDLRSLFNQLRNQATIATGSNATCNSGTHCRRCPGRHDCEAAITGGMQLYEAASQPFPIGMSNAAVGLQLSIVRRAKKQMEYLESGLEKQVESKIRGGELVPGHIAEDKYGHKTWTRSYAEIVAMGEMQGKDLRKEVLKTPTQAVAMGLDEEIIKEYSTIPHKGIKIVPHNTNDVKRIFSQR